jgi:hypothetical protein
MMNSTRLILGLGLAVASLPALAGTYTSEAGFLAAIEAPYYKETFDAFDALNDPGGADPALYASPQSFAGQGFAYTASASGFHNFQGTEPSLAVNQFDDVLTITFTSNNVRAFGGDFYETDASGVLVPLISWGNVTINFNTGSPEIYAVNAPSTFFGFTAGASGFISSIVFEGAGGPGIFATLDNFVVGTPKAGSVPEPSSMALLTLGACCLRLRRRNI